MAKGEQEVEVKFMLKDLPGLEERLKQRGAVLDAARVQETNLRFDSFDHQMRNSNQVLRLRRDTKNILTYKGPQRSEGGASARQEIELEVNDYGAARRFLEALGFDVQVMYEKFRTTYRLGEVLVTLDEMPYGNFIEIEYNGEQDASAAIQSAALSLNLDWNTRSESSYLGLFDHLCAVRGLRIRHLTFDELREIQVTPEDLGLNYADADY